jgi:crotonobetainyl-CoA:carnitine CoA-transferase CaiB-like acyl-CoA transferase
LTPGTGTWLLETPIFNHWLDGQESVSLLRQALAPGPFPENRNFLKGIKVLGMTHVVAGPSISKTLAEHGASVLKVTSSNLPDVPCYAVDLSFEEQTVDLDLEDPTDRVTFGTLLEDVDVIVDGYRPDNFSRLGYGVEELPERFKDREKGFVFMAENCFKHVGPWSQRSGWQPIAVAVSGLARGQVEALQKYVPGMIKLSNEKGAQPVLLPFPISDFWTGCDWGCESFAGTMSPSS